MTPASTSRTYDRDAGCGIASDRLTLLQDRAPRRDIGDLLRDVLKLNHPGIRSGQQLVTHQRPTGEPIRDRRENLDLPPSPTSTASTATESTTSPPTNQSTTDQEVTATQTHHRETTPRRTYSGNGTRPFSHSRGLYEHRDRTSALPPRARRQECSTSLQPRARPAVRLLRRTRLLWRADDRNAAGRRRAAQAAIGAPCPSLCFARARSDRPRPPPVGRSPRPAGTIGAAQGDKLASRRLGGDSRAPADAGLGLPRGRAMLPPLLLKSGTLDVAAGLATNQQSRPRPGGGWWRSRGAASDSPIGVNRDGCK